MRLMGKRQIGQMQLSELVTVTMLSELASYSILDTDIPVLYSVIPVIVLISLEVSVSYLSVKSRFIARLVDGKPSIIIRKGKLDRAALEKTRLTLAEVISELRVCGICSLSDVYYMILEPSGKIAVIPKHSRQPVTPQDAEINVVEAGIDHALILDGKVNRRGLSDAGKSDAWLREALKKHKVASVSDVFYFSCDDAGNTSILYKR